MQRELLMVRNSVQDSEGNTNSILCFSCVPAE